MARISEQAKARALEKVFLRVKQSPNGISEQELADATGIHRRTVNNYLNEMRDEGKVERAGILWFLGDFDEVRSLRLEVTPEEAYTYYLGSRLLVKQHDKRNQLAEAALLKLADALAANKLVGSEISQAAQDLARRPGDPIYETVFQSMVRGYLQRKRVELTYKPLNGKPFSTIFETYLMEPSAIGYSTYVIGHSSLPNARRAYKLERIIAAELLNEEYRIPSDFPGLEVLRNSWSIIMGDEVVKVELRFSPQVRERVLETQWHPSQEYSDDPEKTGWLRWWIYVAGTVDIEPWVRSWGSDVEVLGPPELRAAAKWEALRLAELYTTIKNRPEYFAHFRQKGKHHKQPQYLVDHLAEVSVLAGNFAAKIGLREVGQILGLLHDLGKASTEFQNYILSGEGLLDSDSDDFVDVQAKKGKVDHSTAGAQLIYEKLHGRGPEGQVVGQMIALCLASHHSGLIDCLSPDGKNGFQARIEKEETRSHKNEACRNLPDIERKLDELLSSQLESSAINSIKALREENESQDTFAFKRGLLVRFLFSCLIDADRTNTSDFEFPANSRIRNLGQYSSWQTLLQRLDTRLHEFETKENKNSVDLLRSQVSQACFDASTKPRGVYQLTVPTGGGKTLGSLRFALNHAAHHEMDRIIYVIPYTSIIDQNADSVRKIIEDRDPDGRFLDKNVLEHHSNLTPNEESIRQSLLAQNWDAPVVFTTQVQFLEVLFGSGTRGARRMHQLANSVIILDEIQTVPISCIHMLNVALRFLANSCGATVVLCTATQPPLDKLDTQSRQLVLSSEYRIISNENALFEKLRRVLVFDKRKIGGWSENEISELVEKELENKGSVLIIVNTRRAARTLFQELKDRGFADVHHLSTSMCPAHRVAILDRIYGKLGYEPVICVSTQLIEAGIDIDFGAVIRFMAGMDSIAQAAGRCNRHGQRKEHGHVWIINPKDENLHRLRDIEIGRQKAERVLDEYNADPLRFDNDRIGPAAMSSYFRHYFYERRDEMNYDVGPDSPVGANDNLFSLLSLNSRSVSEYARVHGNVAPNIYFRQSFHTAAKSFHVIDTASQGVIVPFESEGREIIEQLCNASELREKHALLKRAQRYSVNLFPHEFAQLASLGAIRETQPGHGVYYLNALYYSELFGWSDKRVGDQELLAI